MARNELIGRKVTIKDSGSVKQWTIAATTCLGDLYLADSDTGLLSSGHFHPDRLELVPLRGPAGPKGYIGVGDYRCTADEATEWFVFLMLQAGQLFTGVPETDETRDEIKRLLTVRGLSDDGPDVTAALAYYDAAAEWYRKDAEGDE